MLPYLQILRPRQWLKNLMLFFPPFLNGSLYSTDMWHKGGLSFVVFCLASSATYVVNDVYDQAQDRVHPKKNSRPIASGTVTTTEAKVIGVCLLTIAVILSFNVSSTFSAWLMVYLGVSFCYTAYLKHQPVIDIFCIASGFVFRLMAGGAAFGVVVSDWLFLSVMLLALFLSSGKRLGEKTLLGTNSGDHRRALDKYPPGVLEGFMYLSGAAVLVSYAMYAITMQRLFYSVPLCCYGLFRYLLMVKQGDYADPTESLLRDPQMLVIGAGWVLMVAWSFYM